MTAALEGGEWSAARLGSTLSPGKTRYPFYGRLGGPQGRSGRAENLVPTGIRSRTVQLVVSRYTDLATGPTRYVCARSEFISHATCHREYRRFGQTPCLLLQGDEAGSSENFAPVSLGSGSSLTLRCSHRPVPIACRKLRTVLKLRTFFLVLATHFVNDFTLPRVTRSSALPNSNWHVACCQRLLVLSATYRDAVSDFSLFILDECRKRVGSVTTVTTRLKPSCTTLTI